MNKVYSYVYDQSYYPAMPTVEVTLSTPHNTQIVRRALLDSGADASMIPLVILKEVGARYSSQACLRGITNDSQLVNLYLVNLQIGSLVIHAIEAIATDDDEMILGRDVLNQLVVLLNGPAEMVEIESE